MLLEMCCSYWCLCDDNLMLELCLETNTYESISFSEILISCWFSQSYRYSEALCHMIWIWYNFVQPTILLSFVSNIICLCNHPMIWVLVQFILYRSIFCYAKNNNKKKKNELWHCLLNTNQHNLCHCFP